MEIALINDDSVILLILKLFMKIVTILTIVIKNICKIRKRIMEIVLINDDAIIPMRASKGSAGLDLYSSIEVGSINKINTRICISLPENSYGSYENSNSLAAKGLSTLGGVIDSDYTGKIIVIMTSLIESIKIKKGQKIAQLIVSNITYLEIKKVKCLKKTKRNNKGFGKMDL